MREPIILASASPRRRELITALGIPVDVVPSGATEEIEPGTPPAEMVTELAIRKAQVIARDRPGSIMIGADTTVTIDDQILNKPADLEDAERMLRLLRGRIHHVFSGLAVITPDEAPMTSVSTSTVSMRDVSDAELRDYLMTGESLDKAGAYGIQGAAGEIVASVEGCYTNVVGLPLCALARLLLAAGTEITAPAPACGHRADRVCPWWPVASTP